MPNRESCFSPPVGRMRHCDANGGHRKTYPSVADEIKLLLCGLNDRNVPLNGINHDL